MVTRVLQRTGTRPNQLCLEITEAALMGDVVSAWAELRKVKVSQSIDGRSVVDEGLKPGERVITGGQFKVQPGTTVTTAVASSDPASHKVQQE